MAGWYGVDLDGTLAEYGTWRGFEHIGAPIPKMVARVKEWRAQGIEVRVFTARVCEDVDGCVAGERDPERARRAIEMWCLEHIGAVLPVTNVKDFDMLLLFDDRCVAVDMNTGELGSETLAELRRVVLRILQDGKGNHETMGRLFDGYFGESMGG